MTKFLSNMRLGPLPQGTYCSQRQSFATNDGQLTYLQIRLADRDVSLLQEAVDVGEVIRSLNHSDEKVRFGAVCYLSGIKSLDAVKALIPMLCDERPRVGHITHYALKNIGDLAIDPLIQTLKSEDDTMSDYAALTLAFMGTSALQPLLTALSDVSPSIRAGAAYAIARLICENECPRELLSTGIGQIEDNAIRSGLLQVMAAVSDHPNAYITDTWLKDILNRAENLSTEPENVTEATVELDKETLRERMMRIADTIEAQLLDVLRLSSNLSVHATTGLNDLSMVSLGVQQEMRVDLRILQQTADYVELEDAQTEEEIEERIQALNFIVHHMVAHAVQYEGELSESRLSTRRYRHIEHDDIQLHANRTMLDRFAFDLARKVYVYEDDKGSQASNVEHISIAAFAVAAGIVLREHMNGTQNRSVACLARLAAVSREMSENPSIDQTLSSDLQRLADDFKNQGTANGNATQYREFDELIKNYRRIFQSNELNLSIRV